MEWMSMTFQKAKQGDPLAIIAIVLLVFGITALFHGFAGRCRISDFKASDSAHYGCTIGLFFRGLTEDIPVPESVRPSAP